MQIIGNKPQFKLRHTKEPMSDLINYQKLGTTQMIFLNYKASKIKCLYRQLMGTVPKLPTIQFH